jgi:cellulose synthase operon protein C
MTRFAAALLVFALSSTSLDARADFRERDVEIDRSAARDLYIRARPPAPERPELPPVLAERLERTEAQVRDKRELAIRLLREFLAGEPTGDGRAEGLFKLAELVWEDARQRFLDELLAHERALERCRRQGSACREPPPEPELDLSEAESLYLTLLRDHPGFRRTDLVLYLAGFAAQHAGRDVQALERLAELIERFPRSPLIPDAWMMIGEAAFSRGEWASARTAFERVLDYPQSGTYDMALFKAAWCDWQLGDSERAATRFKAVLDLADRADAQGQRERERRAQLRDEALDYLVLVFTEDESVSARDAYEFLASIGGRRYSREVLTRLAQMFYDQGSYERSVAAYHFLIELDPAHPTAADHQRRVVENHLAALSFQDALAATDALVRTYGPGSEWAETQPDARRRDRAFDEIEEMVRTLGKTLHAEAQTDEERRGRPDLNRYQLAERAYASYLERFDDHEHAAEVRFLRAEILYFKVEDYERAGDEYLAVGRTAPVGEYHRDALLRAMNAFERVRPDDLPQRGGRELLPVDRKFAEATDLYATLFPDDPEIVDVVFRNGMLFYDYGDFDEAVKRFGLIVTQHPDSPNAGPAGDRILEALGRSEDYENIETWARRLKDAPAFAAADQQARLDRLIVESILHSGQQYAEGGRYERAARFYLRVPAEFPDHPAAPESLLNAGVMLERARQPEEAARVYLRIVDEHPRSELAEGAGFSAAQVYESFAYFDRAAEAYERVAEAFPRGKHGADALFNAGVLRQALGQPDRAIAHYERYAQRYRRRDDAEEVAFRVGVVHQEAGDDGRAFQAFQTYIQRYSSGAHLIEAHVRAARAALRLGRPERAENQLRAALTAYERRRGDRDRYRAQAAEARYLQGELLYREYAAISLDVEPARLRRTLDRKTALLERAQGIYLDVVDYGDPSWATAALYRIGSVFDEYARSLREAAVPDGLSEAQAERYREELDIYVIDVEERAIDLYTVGYGRALDLGVYNEFTSRLREALGRMSPSSYPPEREARGRQRVGERAPELDIIVEVRRRGRE